MTSVDGGHVNRELQRLAREHHGRDTQALQVLYAIEGFLRRLSVSDYPERMVLKGGMLLAVLDARRMTRDADLSAHGIANDESSADVTALVDPLVRAADASTSWNLKTEKLLVRARRAVSSRLPHRRRNTNRLGRCGRASGGRLASR